jgi:hypothetical protein
LSFCQRADEPKTNDGIATTRKPQNREKMIQRQNRLREEKRVTRANSNDAIFFRK